jgi:hypothetical protein
MPEQIQNPDDSNNEKISQLSAHTADNKAQFLTTDQGVKINDDQNSLKAGREDQHYWKILFCGKKLRILITKGFLNVWCMLEVPGPRYI